MPTQDAPAPEFEVAKYVCPNSQLLLPLMASQPLVFVHWPLVVKACPSCGGEHVLNLPDVQHPPIYGYE